VCEKIFCSAKRALDCEKSHTCKHEPVYEFDDASYDAWYFNVKGISATCNKCNMSLGGFNFEDISDSQKIMEKIYRLVDEYMAEEKSDKNQ